LLDGLTFAAKDNIDVAGAVTGAGNPDWRAAAHEASVSAPCVTALLAAGATLVGRTVSDELAFSLEGRNAFDGTPVNPACPDRLPGGSSSGSAVAVAAGLVDFAIGTDTGGSVRVPASFCGVFGFRPTHGRVSLEGVVPLAPSYDTVGWFAREAAVLARVGAVLLGEALSPAEPVRRGIVADDAFDVLDPDNRYVLSNAARDLGLSCLGVPAGGVAVFRDEQALAVECYRVLQGAEIWRALGPWIAQSKPRFAPDIAARFRDSSRISAKEVDAMVPVRSRIAERLIGLVPPGTVLLLPTAPAPALSLDASDDEIGRFYANALALTSVAGHAGLPQLTIPGAVTPDGYPLGLSLIGWPNGDESLLRFAGGGQNRSVADPSHGQR
jgi:amidase